MFIAKTISFLDNIVSRSHHYELLGKKQRAVITTYLCNKRGEFPVQSYYTGFKEFIQSEKQ